jgi:hypothetical protein
VAAEALSYGARCLLARRRERKPQQVPSGAHPTHKPKGPASALLPPAVGPAWVFRASKTLPQHHCRHARPLLRWPGITLRKRPPGDGPGRTRTCDPLLRRREHLLRATAPCRSSRSASDGSHTAAAFCCGLPLPPRFHVDPPATAIAMSATAPLLLFVQSARGRSARRHARIARGSGRRPGGSTCVRMEPLCASGTAGRDRRPSAAVGSEEPWRLGECGRPTADRDGGSCGAWLTDRRE